MNGKWTKLPAWALAPIALGIVALYYFQTAPELWRGPLMEARGAVGLISRYEVSYAPCAGHGHEEGRGFVGIVRGLEGRYRMKYVAENEADAVAFARAARPGCRITEINRLKRFALGVSHHASSRRRVEVELGAYPA